VQASGHRSSGRQTHGCPMPWSQLRAALRLPRSSMRHSSPISYAFALLISYHDHTSQLRSTAAWQRATKRVCPSTCLAVWLSFGRCDGHSRVHLVTAWKFFGLNCLLAQDRVMLCVLCTIETSIRMGGQNGNALSIQCTTVLLLHGCASASPPECGMATSSNQKVLRHF
jgi:hypothetical protein